LIDRQITETTRTAALPVVTVFIAIIFLRLLYEISYTYITDELSDTALTPKTVRHPPMTLNI
jgi:hypothetical protein